MAVPARRMTNHDLAQIVETSDEWIRERTGIGARYVAGPDETSATLGAAAARLALAMAGVAADTLDLIVCATSTPDHLAMPSTACLIQHALGAARAAAFDVSAACTGFVYGLAVGSQFIASGVYRSVLVIGADTLTRFLDWADRGTCVLFGDGAGAVLLTASSAPAGLLGLSLGADGSKAGLLLVPAGGGRQPLNADLLGTSAQYLQMNGREIYRFGVRTMVDAITAAITAADLPLADIDLLVPHQANSRIILSAAEALGVPRERVMLNIERYGNTSAASIPIALCEAAATGRLAPGDDIVIVGMGGGLTWGAGVLRWTQQPAAPVVATGRLAQQPVLAGE
ncbi:MAG: ketoacyl-ACP synthase III [Chloroflexi bacterium]|nr:ketoacyl-ACP synthase III [Chloroflexota bacterium]